MLRQIAGINVLIDPGDTPIHHYQPQLRRLAARAKRRPGYTLMVVCRHAVDAQHRAQAWLTLARQTVPHLTTLATTHYDLDLREGLQAVAQQGGFQTLLENGQLTPAKALSFFASSPHPIIPQPPQPLAPDPTADCVLATLCRNPAIPLGTLAALLDLSLEDTSDTLTLLIQDGLCESADTSFHEPLYSATDAAVRRYIEQRKLPAYLLKRYRFYRADHLRRPHHTLAVYRFFQALYQQCRARSRARRKLDVLPGQLNDTGTLPHSALAYIESEMLASDWFVREDQPRIFRPDGYGALRIGHAWTHFWLEMDGTSQARSRKSATIWESKLRRLCEYVQTERWRLRYPTLPRLLVVSTDLHPNHDLICDALHYTSRAKSMAPPQVYIASSAALQQRGPIAKVWLDVTRGNREMVYAFDGCDREEP